MRDDTARVGVTVVGRRGRRRVNEGTIRRDGGGALLRMTAGIGSSVATDTMVGTAGRSSRSRSHVVKPADGAWSGRAAE
jgi:hypothetical protein